MSKGDCATSGAPAPSSDPGHRRGLRQPGARRPAAVRGDGDEVYLEQARSWVADADAHHWDTAAGGYFVSADDTRDVIVRSKSINDHAAPAGNGTMVEVLARLYLHTGEETYRSRADALVQLFSGDSPQYLLSVPGLLSSAELLQRPIQVVIIGDRDDPAAEELRAAAFETPSPLLAILSLQPDSSLAETHPAFGKGIENGRPAAYVCVGMTCSPPMVEPAELRRHLAAA